MGGIAVPSAKAADLGGDCCADLEERVAELEATTARKGNRKMSLTVSGQVNRAILYWNDTRSNDVYAGLDNHNQSTRFVFSGTAKVTPKLTAGFEFMTEWAPIARTSGVTQFNVDGANAPLSTTPQTDGTLAVRTANWWLEDATLGRITVGRINVGGPVGTIDLGGISTAAHYAPSLVGGGFFINPNYATNSGTVTLGRVDPPVYGGDRGEGIRYDSPNLMGFLLQAAYLEDQVMSASLRYAGDWAGFRVAAGIGMQHQSLDSDQFSSTLATNLGGLDTGGDPFLRGKTEWAGSVAVMHTASGLFAQGMYGHSHFYNDENAHYWQIQGGISKNWFGVGNTSLYGEYGRMVNYAQAGVLTTLTGDSDVKYIGLGAVQQLDAAAMELYVSWRRFDTSDVSGTVSPTVPFGAFTTTGIAVASTAVISATTNGGPVDHIDLIMAGARIRF